MKIIFIGILKQGEAGVKIADLCREHGVGTATFYGWKQKYGGMEVAEAQRLKALEDENRRLNRKRPVLLSTTTTRCLYRGRFGLKNVTISLSASLLDYLHGVRG